MKTVRTNGNANAPTYGANMLAHDVTIATKAGFNVNAIGQPEVWDVNGTAGTPVRVLYRSTAASTAHAAASEALFDTNYALPANSLKAGSVLKIKFQGIVSAADGGDNLTIRLYIGGLSGTTLLVGTATTGVANQIF